MIQIHAKSTLLFPGSSHPESLVLHLSSEFWFWGCQIAVKILCLSDLSPLKTIRCKIYHDPRCSLEFLVLHRWVNIAADHELNILPDGVIYSPVIELMLKDFPSISEVISGNSRGFLSSGNSWIASLRLRVLTPPPGSSFLILVMTSATFPCLRSMWIFAQRYRQLSGLKEVLWVMLFIVLLILSKSNSISSTRTSSCLS